MNITIDTYRIKRIDDLNLVVEEELKYEKGKSKGKTYWEFRGYFPNVRMALNKLSILMQNESQDMKDLLKRLDRHEAFTASLTNLPAL